MASNDAVMILVSGDVDRWQALRKSSSGSIDLSYAKISGSLLVDFDFTNCDFDGASFDDCDLRRSKFDHSSIRDANFRNCALAGATFYRASLRDTVFDSCNLSGIDFSESYDIEEEQFELSYYDDSTLFPAEFSYDDWIDETTDPDSSDEIDDGSEPDDEGDDVEDKSEKNSVKKSRIVPNIPERVVAPLETFWRSDKLYVSNESHINNLSPDNERQMLTAIRKELSHLCVALSDTNFDHRIVDDLKSNSVSFPKTVPDFRRKVISTWFNFRSIFEYVSLTRGQHSDYIEAKILSFELNLRDVLLTYEDFRQYEAESQAVKITENFDYGSFLSHQVEFISSLKKLPENVDQDVAIEMEKIFDWQTRYFRETPKKPIFYGAASSIANVISRILLKVVNEISKGAAEAVKESTKKIVSTVIATGGGAVLLWLLSVGTNSFTWLKQAWTFVKNILQF